MRKTLLWIIAAVSIHCASLADTITVDGYTWTYSRYGLTATIEGVSPTSGNIEIPSVVNGRNVVAIKDSAFSDCTKLTGVIIPNSVTNIGECAFLRCSGLTRVTIPNGVTSIEAHAFNSCSKLASITIPDSVTHIGSSAFEGCNGLKSVHISNIAAWCRIIFDNAVANPVNNAHNLFIKGELISEMTIPDGVDSIGNYSFCGCSCLASVTIPDGVASIGDYAFAGCSGLTSVTIPNSVRVIGSNAFRNCSSLESVTIPGSLVRYGEYVFASCSGLLNVNLCHGVRAIGNYWFKDCSNLTSVIIPESVTSIGEQAFYNCDSLESITIPKSVTSIGKWAFYLSGSLSSVTFLGNAPTVGTGAFYKVAPGCIAYVSDDATGYVADEYGEWKYLILVRKVILEMVRFDANGGKVDEVSREVESGKAVGALPVPTRPGYGFNGWWTEIGGGTQVDATTPIVDDVIYYAHWTKCVPTLTITGGVLTHVSLNGAVHVSIPDGVASIGDYAFAGCSGLTSVTIPYGVTRIGAYAFADCQGLTSITIPDSVTEIGWGAFIGCSGLTSIAIPEGVAELTQCMFYGCSSLTGVAVPNSVKSIGGGHYEGADLLRGVFYDCTALANISIPEGVTNIGEYAFYNCRSLKTLTMPDSVKHIGECAFFKCSGLERLELPVDVDVDLYGNVLGGGAVDPTCAMFWECNAIKDVTFPGKCLMEGRWSDYWIISGWSRLSSGDSSSVTLNGQFDEIPKMAFSGNKQLVSIVVLGDIARIGDYAFSWCENLSSITLIGDAPAVGYNAFQGVAADCVLYVDEDASGYEVDDSGKWNGLAVARTVTLDRVVFDPNGGDVGETCRKVYSGRSIGTLPIAVRDGWTFAGWTLESGEEVDEFMVVRGGDVTLKAKWMSGEWDFSVSDGGVTVERVYACEGSVVVPDVWQGLPVVRIAEDAFRGCNGMTSVTIPRSVVQIEDGAFSDCDSLTEIIVDPENGAYRSENGLLLTKNGSVVVAGVNGDVAIPDCVSRIGCRAFGGLDNLRSVAVPSSVTVIDEAAFEGIDDGVSVVFAGKPPSFGGMPGFSLSQCSIPSAYSKAWMATIYDLFGFKCEVKVLSSAIRETDKFVLDVTYRVDAPMIDMIPQKVKVRALAFEDGDRRFAKAVRPVTFIDGTDANIGDEIEANVEHTLSWMVSADWEVKLAKMNFEVLAVSGELLPLKLKLLPASDRYGRMAVSFNDITSDQVYDALMWLVASGDAGIENVDGRLQRVSDGATIFDGVSYNAETMAAEIASGSAAGDLEFVEAVRYIFEKMGYGMLEGDELEYAREETRLDLESCNVRRYAFRIVE